MNYTLLKNDEINREEWMKLVATAANSTFFQSPECYSFYKQLSFLQAFAYGVLEENILKAVVVGYIIAEKGQLKRFFSRRAIIPGGMLIGSGTSESSINFLLVKLKQHLSKDAIYVEFRNYTDYSPYISVFEKNKFFYKAHLNYQLAIIQVDSVFHNLSESKKRQIKQTEKAGIYCELSNSYEDIGVFYKLLQTLYNNKVRKPLFPDEFFYKLVSSNTGKLLLVRSKTEILGGSVLVHDANTVYEWFICGIDKSNEKIYPSVMATWGAINYCIDNGYKKFDFMGAGKPNDTYGVREFKAKFGGKEIENGRFLYIYNRYLYYIGEFVISLKILF